MNGNQEMKKERNNILILMLSIALVIVLVGGGTMAWLSWSSENNTAVSITVTGGTLTIDGGGDITSGLMAPTNECNHDTYAIKRTITASAVNGTVTDMKAYIQLYTNSDLFPNIYKMENLEWVISSSATDCSTSSNILASGNFSNIDNSSDTSNKENTPLDLISFSVPSGESVNKTYYLYIWVNEDYTVTNVGDTVTSSIQDVSFTVQLTGKITNDPYVLPEEPVLDDGMIPVTLSADGVATTVNKSDSSWYSYEDKEWANVVLVDNDSRSTYQNTSGVTVNQSDILAYYVWIPRYKYRITEQSCSDTNNSTITSHPDCYLPFSMSDTDKNSAITWWQEWMINNIGIEYTTEQATTDVNDLLTEGTAYIDVVGASISIAEFIDMYNSENETAITYTGTFNGNNTTSGPNTVDISFEVGDSKVSQGDAVTSFKTHPAFVWDETTVSGIWVGKFETTGSATTPTILPNIQSLRSQNVSAQFTTSLLFAGGTLTDGNVSFSGSSTYGLTSDTDSHMMKNSEWGAVAYLSHSQYGINSEIYINNSSGYYTGRSGGNVGGSVNTVATQYSGETSTNQYISKGYYTWTGQTIDSSGTIGDYASDRTLGTNASTTGNVTGIYDMSGGAWEYVMGVLSDSNGNSRSGNSSSWNSGFNGIIYDSGNNTEYTSGISFPDSKYYDLYLQNQFNGDYSTNMTLCTLDTCGGHALNETAGWYSDYAYFVGAKFPWFGRGGNCGSGAGAGAFYSYGIDGDANGYYSWRSVLVVGTGA